MTMLAVILLAAGRSVRFGARDKLTERAGGLSLAQHAAQTLAGLPFAVRLAIVAAETPSFDLDGFHILTNRHPEAGLSGSIAIGVRAAREAGASGVLIALADMPLVSAGHFRRIVERYEGPDSLVASSSGGRAMPPALFGANWYTELETLAGDAGARHLLDRAVLIEEAADELIDVDTEQDLATVRRILGDRQNPPI